MNSVEICLVVRRMGDLSYTPRACMFCFWFVRVSVTHREMEFVGSFGHWGGEGGSLKRPVLESVASFGGSGVSLTPPVLETDRLSGKGVGMESMYYAPCALFCPVICRVGILPYTPRPCICLIVWQVGSLYYMPRAGICLVVRREGNHYYTASDVICLVLCWWGVSLTRLVLESVWLFVVAGVCLVRPVLQLVLSFG